MTEEHYLDHDGNLISRKVTSAPASSSQTPPTKTQPVAHQSHAFPSLLKRLPRAGDQEGDPSGTDSHT